MGGKRRVKSLNNALTLICIIMFVALFAFVVNMDTKDLKEQEQTYIMREESLKRQIREEEERTKALEERKKYITTKQYIEEIAREKLGLLNPDEVLLKEKED